MCLGNLLLPNARVISWRLEVRGWRLGAVCKMRDGGWTKTETKGKKAGDRVWGRTPRPPDLQTKGRPGPGSCDYLQVFTSIKPRSSYTILQDSKSSPNIFPHREDVVPILYCPSLLSGIQGLAIQHALNG
jgi:hypothetical protein